MKKGLSHPLALKGFSQDFVAMHESDACVLLLPCGKSAHLEGGWFIGNNKPMAILLDIEVQPELMYLMSPCVTTKLDEVINYLRRLKTN